MKIKISHHQRTAIFIWTIAAIPFILDKCYAQNDNSHSGKIVVEIRQFRSNNGKVAVALYGSEYDFLKTDRALAIKSCKIDHSKASLNFENLKPGEYAISIHHDENGNDKFDTNFIGIPKEGVGASNDAKGHFGPPKYSDAKFVFDGKEKTIIINVSYLL